MAARNVRPTSVSGSPADQRSKLLDRARSLERIAQTSPDPDLAGRASAWAVEARSAASDLDGAR